MKYYMYVSPSLDGVLTHDSLSYEGIHKPVEILQALDSPRRNPKEPLSMSDSKQLERYFYDLYGVFMKKFSSFALSEATDETEIVKLQAILQEIIKVKKWIGKGGNLAKSEKSSKS